MMTSEGYPRPDFERTELCWQSLDGGWDFVFDDDDQLLSVFENGRGGPEALRQAKSTTIKVPYVFQTQASTINQQGRHEVLWYSRSFQDLRTPANRHDDKRMLLRFGAVDYEAMVWIDGQLVGSHRGGHVPFDVDVTGALQATDPAHQYSIIVRVFDSADDLTQPRGKQYWGPQPESIFYHPSSGIWQPVWLELVPRTRICNSSDGTVLRSDDIEGGELHGIFSTTGRQIGQKYEVELEVGFQGTVISHTTRQELPNTKRVRVDANMRLDPEHFDTLPANATESAPVDDSRCWLNGVALWSPEHPQLYSLTMRLYNKEELIDEVKTTIGMRSITWDHGDGSFRLNGHPQFQALLLDQGYWPKTQMTPPSSNALREDILLSKAMGFNGCRKHQKVEDPRFMYWADQLGFLVWGEMASTYRFSQEMVSRFDEEWTAMVKRDINHPCIVAWTLANESWGYDDLASNEQHRNHLRSLYYATKTLDPSRPINDNCGWQHVITDLSTFHDYADAPGMRERCETETSILNGGRGMFLPSIADRDPGSRHNPHAPIICSEFGGINIAAAGGGDTEHERGWGYTTAKDGDDLVQRLEALCMAVVEEGHCCGFVYTQLTDIEQETNGLYTFDRKAKLDAGKVKAVVEKAAQTYLTMRERKHGVNRVQRGFRAPLSSAYVRALRLEQGRWLVAECATAGTQGLWQRSKLDLDDCLANSWGRLAWAKGGNFCASSRDVRLEDASGVVLRAEVGTGGEAEAGTGGGGWRMDWVKLGERIWNQGGKLVFR
ncbi:hypothetical protein MBLNU230_g0499t1 [Neophaeotheca triangularis]